MKKKQRLKKPKNHRRNKKAFDSVMAYVRRLGTIVTVRAINMEATAETSPNPARPTPVDFRCDVDRIIKRTLPKGVSVEIFYMTYVHDASEDAIEREQFAQKVFGDSRHVFEEALGAAFIRSKIFPVQGKGYFHTVR